MKTIQLANNKGMVMVDEEDFERVNQYSWCLNGKGYVNGSVGFLHRFIMNTPKGMCVDHINHNTLDNQKHNLRLVTYSQNNMNRRKNSKKETSLYKGVCYNKHRNKWRCCIKLNGKSKEIGSFTTEEQSALAYNDAAKQYHGEFALLNNILEDK